MTLLKRYHPILIIIAIACLIVFPRRSGYMMLLDLVSVPVYSMQIIHRYDGIMWTIIHMIKILTGGMISQYIIVMSALIGLGYGAYRLVSIEDFGIHPVGIRFATIFAMINPFVYSRVIEGQYNVYGGYALIMLGLYYLYQSYKRYNLTNIIVWSVLAGLALSLLYHSLFFIIVLNSIFLIGVISRREKIRRYLYSIGIILMININRIFFAVQGTSDIGQTVNQINNTHIAGFETLSGPFGVMFHSLSLHGFWGEMQGRFTSNHDFNTQRGILFGILFVGIVYGYYLFWRSRQDRRLIKWIITIAIIAYTLSMGIAAPTPFRQISQFLYDYIPFYTGLREPQKRLGIVLVCYIIGGARGFGEIYRRIVVGDSFRRRILGIVIIALPVIYTPGMLFALRGQLTVVDYPKDYYIFKQWIYETPQYNQILQDNITGNNDFDILVLPWHQYMRLSFAETKTMPNPRGVFFETNGQQHINLLIGDNMEMEQIYTQSIRPESKVIEQYVGPDGIRQQLYTSALGKQFVQDLQKMGISYIFVFHELDGHSNNTYLENLARDGFIQKTKHSSEITTRILQ